MRTSLHTRTHEYAHKRAYECARTHKHTHTHTHTHTPAVNLLQHVTSAHKIGACSRAAIRHAAHDQRPHSIRHMLKVLQ